jgi:hypothetical protein
MQSQIVLNAVALDVEPQHSRALARTHFELVRVKEGGLATMTLRHIVQVDKDGVRALTAEVHSASLATTKVEPIHVVHVLLSVLVANHLDESNIKMNGTFKVSFNMGNSNSSGDEFHANPLT